MKTLIPISLSPLMRHPKKRQKNCVTHTTSCTVWILLRSATLQFTAQQVALAWTIREAGVTAIPKATRAGHVRDNVAAAELRLDEADLEQLERAFPRPDRPIPLETL